VNNTQVAVVGKECGYWLGFGVAVPLAQLWLILLFYYLTKTDWSWVGLVGNGSLLFFATTTTSRTAGEYFKRENVHHWAATLLCIVVTLVVIVASVFAYALVVATRAGVLPVDSLSPERITTTTDALVIFGLIFSLSYSIYMRVSGE